MPETIVNASTLINLASIGELSLLKTFEKEIIVPSEVWEEVVVQGEGQPGAEDVKQGKEAGWIHVMGPSNKDLVTALNHHLDPGESAAIALAVERDVEWVFLDESDAREMAKSYNLQITGVLGLLIRAYREEMIKSLEKALRRLQEEAGFWISNDLCAEILEQAEEE